MSQIIKNWLMVALTLIIVLLFTATLFGWLKLSPDMSTLTRLEPIVFVALGYYFSRLPALQNEKTLKDEIDRQIKRTDAAHYAKEKAQMEREMLEEKIKNVIIVLRSVSSFPAERLENNTGQNIEAVNKQQNSLIKTAINILGS